jgi:ABC-type transport system involved in Fe-S cluster assembly fused permease/ATPase subunit
MPFILVIGMLLGIGLVFFILDVRYVSVTIVLMVMLMLVLARMLIFRTLVKRSTVHNNGDGDVNVRNDVKRSRKCLVLYHLR